MAHEHDRTAEGAQSALSSEAREKLRQAASLIEEAQSELDTRYERCEGCGLNHYSNWTHYLINQQLVAMVEKLHRIANRQF